MIRRASRYTRTDTLFPYTTLFRSPIPVVLDALALSPMTKTLALCASIVNAVRSEEHTSELQSLMRISHAVFCLQKNIRHEAISHHTAHPIHSSSYTHVHITRHIPNSILYSNQLLYIKTPPHI